jgi:HEPN domain-containing protein
MATEPDEPRQRIVQSYLQLAEFDQASARLLLSTPETSRNAAYFAQQSAEKLTKAVFTAHGVTVTKEHRLVENLRVLKSIEEANPWTERLAVLIPLDAYATAYRYPSPNGRIPPAPDAVRVLAWLDLLAPFIAQARTEFLPQRDVREPERPPKNMRRRE